MALAIIIVIVIVLVIFLLMSFVNSSGEVREETCRLQFELNLKQITNPS